MTTKNHRKVQYILIVAGIIIVSILFFSGRNLVTALQSYLQPTVRIPDASVLVVEAWLAPQSLRDAKIEFDSGGYALLVIAGSGPSDQTGSPGSPGSLVNKADACNAANYLIHLGVDSARMIPISVESTHLHHTFSSANAVRRWILSSGRTGTAVNVFTVNTHGRKSWVIYQRTLHGVARVGVISDPTWQCYGEPGKLSQLTRMKVLFKHGFGYLYALVWPLFLVK